MVKSRDYKIDASHPAYLRAGIKWDALMRDAVAERFSIHSAEEARKRTITTRLRLVLLQVISILFRLTLILGRVANRIDRVREFKREELRGMKLYLSQEKLASYDLDLCTFCYGADGKLFGFTVADYTQMQGEVKWDPAFVHSGDDTTGTGEAADEELLIDLRAINAAIQRVFIVVVSNNHGFHKVKGGSWSLTSTVDEKELMSGKLQTSEQHRVYVVAGMKRQEQYWLVKEVAEYCPLGRDPKASTHQQVDRALAERYMKGVEQV